MRTIKNVTEEKEKENAQIYRTSQKKKKCFLESLLSESFPALGITVHLPL